MTINQIFNFTILKIIFPILSALKLFVFLFLYFSINGILNIMSSEKFNYIFHLLYYSFILNLHGVLSRRIYFTLFIRFFYISNDGALIGIFNCRISGTSTNNRYNLIRNFGSMLENFLLFYH